MWHFTIKTLGIFIRPRYHGNRNDDCPEDIRYMYNKSWVWEFGRVVQVLKISVSSWVRGKRSYLSSWSWLRLFSFRVNHHHCSLCQEAHRAVTFCFHCVLSLAFALTVFLASVHPACRFSSFAVPLQVFVGIFTALLLLLSNLTPPWSHWIFLRAVYVQFKIDR